MINLQTRKMKFFNYYSLLLTLVLAQSASAWGTFGAGGYYTSYEYNYSDHSQDGFQVDQTNKVTRTGFATGPVIDSNGKTTYEKIPVE